MSSPNTAVIIFPGEVQAERFIEQLQRDGFDMRSVSLFGRDNHADDQEHWQRLGSYWGQIWGCLFGASFLGLPGIGPLVVGGRLARHIMEGYQEISPESKDVLAIALSKLGVKSGNLARYESALRQDRFLVLAACPSTPESLARQMLERIEGCGGEAYLEELAPAAYVERAET